MGKKEHPGALGGEVKRVEEGGGAQVQSSYPKIQEQKENVAGRREIGFLT